MPKKRPPTPPTTFWTTVPGLLTGVAALLTAVVGLFAFLVQPRGAPPSPSSSATIVVQTARLSAAEQSEFATHLVILRVTAPPDLLTRVDRVVYLLPPSFATGSLTSTSTDDGFAVQLKAAGAFQVQAKLHLKDGSTRDATQQITLPAP